MNMQNDLRMENVPLNLIKDLCAVATNPLLCATHSITFSYPQPESNFMA